MLPLEV